MSFTTKFTLFVLCCIVLFIVLAKLVNTFSALIITPVVGGLIIINAVVIRLKKINTHIRRGKALYKGKYEFLQIPTELYSVVSSFFTTKELYELRVSIAQEKVPTIKPNTIPGSIETIHDFINLINVFDAYMEYVAEAEMSEDEKESALAAVQVISLNTSLIKGLMYRYLCYYDTYGPNHTKTQKVLQSLVKITGDSIKKIQN